MAAGCAFLVAACSGEAAVATQNEPAAVAVEVLNIAATGSGGEVRASGLVAFKRETALGFGAPGEIESITADVGDRVVAGQVLATMRKTTTGADASEAALARLTAEQNFDRVTRLHAAGAASQAELDNAKLTLERARERVSIVAPASGIVLQRYADPGPNVPAGQAVPDCGPAPAGTLCHTIDAVLGVCGATPGRCAAVR